MDGICEVLQRYLGDLEAGMATRAFAMILTMHLQSFSQH